MYSTTRSFISHRGERVQVDESLQFGAQVCSKTTIDENFSCQSSSGQRMGESSKKLPAWQLTKVKSNRGGDSGSSKNSPFCCIDGDLSSQKYGVRTEVSEVQRLGCVPR